MPDTSMTTLPAARGDAAAASAEGAGLVATAQLMLFKPGVYSVALHLLQSTRTDIGLALPSVRLDALPPAGPADGRAFVSGTAEGGWLSRSIETAFILVAGGSARVILTTYRGGVDAPAPEIRIAHVLHEELASPVPRMPTGRQVQEAGQPPAAAQAASPAPAAEPPPGAGEGRGRALGINAHGLTGQGHEAGADRWAGVPGTALEGFTITLAPEPGDAEDGLLEYQAIMGSDWDTPWFREGLFCGSRGLSLALMGFRVRLLPTLAATHRCSYWGRFKGGREAGPFHDGAPCILDDAELEAVRLLIEPRGAGGPDVDAPPVTAELAGPPKVRARSRRRSAPQPISPVSLESDP